MRRALLPEGLVERVLQSFRMPAYPERSPAGLTALYRAWCRHVPFDNIRKLIAIGAGRGSQGSENNPLPGDAAADFLEAYLTHRVGGTCWAGNGALCTLLQALGFDATRAVATMVVAPDVPPNHGSVVVRFGHHTYIADASIMHSTPLPVIAGEVTRIEHPAWGVVGHWLDGAFAIRWRPLHRPEGLDCRFDEWRVDADRFRSQHEATRTWSPFNFELNLNLVRGEGRAGIAGGRHIIVHASGHESSAPIHERVRLLVEGFGISESVAMALPPDRPTPPPPNSRTAARVAADGAPSNPRN